MTRTSALRAVPARRTFPLIPPTAERMVRDLVNESEYGEEVRVAEINGHGLSGTEHQFGHTNHFTLRTLLATIAVFGPERSCRALNLTLQDFGVSLQPISDGARGIRPRRFFG